MKESYFEEFLHSHSFVLLQTKNKGLAESLPWVVCSLGTKILEPKVSTSDQTYNHNFNCAFYKFRGKKFVLANIKQAIEFLAVGRVSLLQAYEYIDISEHILLETYVYVPKTKEFVQTDPNYLHRSGIVLFEFDNPSADYQELSPMSTNNSKIEYYSMSSDYALASDDHFLNCLQRGKSLISCYEKAESGSIRPVIDPMIYKWIDSLYSAPKL